MNAADRRGEMHRQLARRLAATSTRDERVRRPPSPFIVREKWPPGNVPGQERVLGAILPGLLKSPCRQGFQSSHNLHHSL